jgi:hypothetical protein
LGNNLDFKAKLLMIYDNDVKNAISAEEKRQQK